MNTTVAKLGTLLLCVLVVCGTILAVLGKDPAVIFTFAASTIIPTALVMYVGQKVEKTQDAAERVVTQTNGRMTELIQNNKDLTEKVTILSGLLEPEIYTETFPPDVPEGVAEVEYRYDAEGNPVLKRH